MLSLSDFQKEETAHGKSSKDGTSREKKCFSLADQGGQKERVK